MTVIGQGVGQGDIELIRGVTSTWTVRCMQDQGSGVSAQDLTGWTGVVTIESDTHDEWLTISVSTDPVALLDGFATVTIPASALTGVVWAGRSLGRWHMEGTAPDGHVERLGEGIVRIRS